MSSKTTRELESASPVFAAVQAAMTANLAAEAARLGVPINELDGAIELEEARRRNQEAQAAARLRRVAVWEAHGRHFPVEDESLFIEDRFEPLEVVQAVRAWWEGNGAVAILSSGKGTGKSLAALSCLAQSSGDYLKAPKLGERYEPWSRDVEAGVKRLDLNAPLLIIDELGRETIDDRFVKAFDEVVDARQGKHRGVRLRTIFITNLGRQQFDERYLPRNDRALDRFKNTAKWMQFANGSLRGKRRSA